MTRDLLSAYLSLVAQDAQVWPSMAVDSRYLLSKARPQDAATLVTLFEVAGRSDTVEIAYDDTKQVIGVTMASALANQRQQAQRFLGTIVT